MDPNLKIAWTPTDDAIEGTRVMRFAAALGIRRFEDLVARSAAEPEWFWDQVVKWFGIEFAEPYTRTMDDSRGPEWATWFVGGKINAAWNCVGRWARDTPDAVALIAETEAGEVSVQTYAELWQDVCRLARGLTSLGVEPGDRVALYLPMIREAVVGSHACALVGAVQVPLFSALAAHAVTARLVDGGVKVVLTADGALRKGKVIPLKATLDEALRDAPSVEHVVAAERFGGRGAWTHPRDVAWADLVEGQRSDLPVTAFDAEHPHCLVYTSGTTGRPKGVVHSTAGLLVKITEEAACQTDVGPGDRVYWVTDPGWMTATGMIIGAGGNGAAVVACEGLATDPPDRIWAQVERHEVTVLGISPTLVRVLMQHGDEPVRRHDLSSIRILASTGEPWNPEPYRWLSAVVGKGRRPIINITGGTEVGTCFLSPSAAMPIKECSVGVPSLGMAVDVVGPSGESIRGEIGELVCRKPWPAMARGVWGDPERYLDAYWRAFPGIWTHGDLAIVDDEGYWFILGRSDDTLNVAGKRVGPAELESVLVGHPAVAECGVVGIPDEVKGEVPWAFCVPAAGTEPSEALGEALGRHVGQMLGKTYEPDRVVFVTALPKTRSQKIVRRGLRALAIGEDPGDLSSLEDPSSIDAVRASLTASPGRPA